MYIFSFFQKYKFMIFVIKSGATGLSKKALMERRDSIASETVVIVAPFQ